MVKSNARKKPLLPDGSEVNIGLVVALALGGILLFNDFPMWSYVSAAVFSFLFCAIGIQFSDEENRQYWKGMSLMKELNEALGEVDPTYISDRISWKHVKAGVQNVQLIFKELLEKSPTRMYGGMHELAPHVRRFVQLYTKYVDLQDNPPIAGDRKEFDRLMQISQEGFQGFDEEMARLLVRINKDDIVNLTVSAELLRSLRNLLSSSSK